MRNIRMEEVGDGTDTVPHSYMIHCFFFRLPPNGGSLRNFFSFFRTRESARPSSHRSSLL